MALTKERIAAILGSMYGYTSEIVIEVSNSQCCLFINVTKQEKLTCEEVNFLYRNDVIEQIGDCGEKGHVTEVYTLTAKAQQKIRELIEKARLLRNLTQVIN